MTSLIRCCFRISIGRSHHYLLKLTIIFQNPCEFLCIVRKLVFEGYIKYTFLPFIISFILSILNPSLQNEFLHIGLGFCIFAWASCECLLCMIVILQSFANEFLHHEKVVIPLHPPSSHKSTYAFFLHVNFSCMQYAVDNLILFSLKNFSHYNVFRLFLLIIPLEILLFSPLSKHFKSIQ